MRNIARRAAGSAWEKVPNAMNAGPKGVRLLLPQLRTRREHRSARIAPGTILGVSYNQKQPSVEAGEQGFASHRGDGF